MIGLYVVGVIPSLGQSLFETHAQRQTQTAFTAVLYARDGIDLLRPPLPVLGPPGTLPQEFPIFQAAGALLIRAGLPSDLAMRLVGLGSFLAAAALLYLVARRLTTKRGALISLAAFLFNPLAWLYGRTALIEYLAVAGSLAFVYLAIRWMDGARRMDWVLAFGAGILAVLVKITTAGFFLVPILLWKSPSGRWGFQRAWAWALVVSTIAVGLAWSSYAQAVREEAPASLFLSLENQYGWFFGTIGERLDILAYRRPLVAVLMLTGSGILLWAPIALSRAREDHQRAFLVALLALGAIVPLTLFNLYSVHDYYWIAISPVIALGVGLGADWLAVRAVRRSVRRMIVGLAGAWVATIIGLSGSWTLIYGQPAEGPRAMQIASFIQQHSSPSDWVVLRGWGWNPAFFYYAQRRGLAVPDDSTIQNTAGVDINRILDDPIYGPFITCDRDSHCIVDTQ